MSNSLDKINIGLNQWMTLIILCFGFLGNFLSTFIFIRPVFNHHVCSWYLFALSINNSIYSLTVLMYRLLTNGFQIQILSNSLELCKFICYMTTFCTSLSHYLIVLAAIDRYSASSSNARRRRFNSFETMPRTIVVTIILCILFSISSPIISDLNLFDDLGCNIRITTTFNQVYIIIQLIFFAFIAPCLMILLTILTIRNKHRAIDQTFAVSKCRHMEAHLSRVVVFIVITHVIMNLFEWIEYLMLLQPNRFQSFQFLQTLIRIPIEMSHAMPFIWYLTQSMEFRRELKKTFPCCNCLWKRAQVNLENEHAHDNHQQQPEVY